MVQGQQRACTPVYIGKSGDLVRSYRCLTHRHTTELDPVGSTVRYEMMKLCTGSVKDTMRWQQLVIDDTGSVEDIHAFIYCKKWRFGQVLLMPD